MHDVAVVDVRCEELAELVSALGVLALGAVSRGAVASRLDLGRRFLRWPIHEAVRMTLVDVERRTAAVLAPEQPLLFGDSAELPMILPVELPENLESLRLEHDVSRRLLPEQVRTVVGPEVEIDAGGGELEIDLRDLGSHLGHLLLESLGCVALALGRSVLGDLGEHADLLVPDLLHLVEQLHQADVVDRSLALEALQLRRKVGDLGVEPLHRAGHGLRGKREHLVAELAALAFDKRATERHAGQHHRVGEYARDALVPIHHLAGLHLRVNLGEHLQSDHARHRATDGMRRLVRSRVGDHLEHAAVARRGRLEEPEHQRVGDQVLRHAGLIAAEHGLIARARDHRERYDLGDELAGGDHGCARTSAFKDAPDGSAGRAAGQRGHADDREHFAERLDRLDRLDAGADVVAVVLELVVADGLERLDRSRADRIERLSGLQLVLRVRGDRLELRAVAVRDLRVVRREWRLVGEHARDSGKLILERVKDLDRREQRRQPGHDLDVLDKLRDLGQRPGFAAEELLAQDLPALQRDDVRAAPVHRRIRARYADVGLDMRIDRLRAVAAAELLDVRRCRTGRQDHRVRALALLHV